MVKVFVATAQSQGHRTNDFHFCVDGELVMLAIPCSIDAGDPDGRCGCARAFHGLNSHQATTTALVKELPGFTTDDYIEALRSSLKVMGMETHDSAGLAREYLALAQEFPTGTVVERRLSDINRRPPA